MTQQMDTTASGPVYAADARLARRHYILLLIYGVVMAFPAFWTGYIPSRDGLIHLHWSSQFTSQLWAGDLYPRWLAEMNDGLGSPVMLFYAPLPYYLTALLRPFFWADPQGWHQLGVACGIAIVLSGFTAYAWLRRVVSAPAALLAALIYLSAPYHLACDLFQRFAFGELWAFVWMPLLLLATDAMLAGRRLAWLALALSYAALITTHLPTTMIFSPVLLCYAFFKLPPAAWLPAALKYGAALALGIGIAMIYLLPALTGRDNVSFGDMLETYFNPAYNFLFYGPRYDDEFRLYVRNQGWLAAVMIVVSVAAFACTARTADRARRAWVAVWFAVALLSFAIMLPPAKPLWDWIGPLRAIQFPWRFNTLLTLAVAALIAAWVAWGGPRSGRWKLWMIVIASLALFAQTVPVLLTYLLISATPGAPSLEKMMNQFGTLVPATRIKLEGAAVKLEVPEYRPRGVPRAHLLNADALRKFAGARPRATIAEEQGTVSVQDWRAGRITLASDARQATWVTLRLFYYPNWQASANGQALPTRPDPGGLLEIEVPSGPQQVQVSFARSRMEQWGAMVSLASLLIAAVLAWRGTRVRGGASVAGRGR